MAEKNVTPGQVRKLLSDPKHRIELHSLVHTETEKVYKTIEALNPQTRNVLAAAKKYIDDFEAYSKTLRMIVAYGSYFGTDDQAYLWSRSLSRLAHLPHSSGNTFLLSLQLYPTLLVFYAAGISSLASENYENIKRLLDVEITGKHQSPKSLVMQAHTWLLPSDIGNQVFGLERRKTPLSDHLYELFAETLPSEVTFGFDAELLFDEWELLIAMVVADLGRQDKVMSSWTPVGRFSWRNEHSDANPLTKLKKELEKEKPDWPPLRAGLLGGSNVRAKDALSVVKNYADRISFF